MSLTVGIDFGTATSSAALIKDGRAQLVPCLDGASAVPSVVAFDYEGHVLVGEPACQFAEVDPSRAVFSAKRFLGRKQYSPEASWLAGVCANEVVPAANGDAWLRIGERSVSPQEICAYVLRHLKDRAEAFAGVAITHAAIAAPAYLGQLQRRALLEAADLAGFEGAALVDDATATAAGCPSIVEAARRLLIMDLGAGYFDVGLLERDGERWKSLACSGDSVLGGDDFDRRIIDLLLMTFHHAHGVDLTQIPSALEQLREKARRAKHELSAAVASSPIELTVAAGPVTGDLEFAHPSLSRDELDAMIGTDLENLSQPCAWAFEDAKLGLNDIDEVLLCGGGAQLPAVRDLVQRMVQRHPHCPEPDAQVVARGAARVGQAMRSAPGAQTAHGTAPHTLGIKARAGRVVPVVERGRPFPGDVDRAFAKPRADQRSIAFDIYQGDSALARDNVYVGRFAIQGLPAGDRFVVRFSIDTNGTLGVGLLNDERSATILVSPSNGLDDDQRRALRAGLAPETTFDIAHASIAPRSEQEPAASIAVGWSDMPPSSSRVPVTCPPPSSDSDSTDSANVPTPFVRPRPARAATLRSVRDAHQLPMSPTDVAAPDADSSAPVEVDVDPLVGSTVGDRYVIKSLLAEGGMGRVYQAEHKILGKRLAVKVLHPELATNQELGARFLREARAAAAIDSDHVVNIIDFGRLEEGTSYFVMEFLEGVTLADWIDDHGASPPELICHVSAQIAEGMSAAHATGIVHRDLKPDNLTLIRRKGNPHFVKILDFGIAKRPTSDGSRQLTLVGTTLGTPHYMAPEQITAGRVDVRTDIYSLGAVMYEMATGLPPFDSEVLALLLAQHLNDAPKPIREHAMCANFPRQLEDLILKCLEKQAANRFQTAGALEAALAIMSSS